MYKNIVYYEIDYVAILLRVNYLEKWMDHVIKSYQGKDKNMIKLVRRNSSMKHIRNHMKRFS